MTDNTLATLFLSKRKEISRSVREQRRDGYERSAETYLSTNGVERSSGRMSRLWSGKKEGNGENMD